MFRRLAATCFLAMCIFCPSHAADNESPVCQACDSNLTTLRLYFAPEIMSAGRDQFGFKPEVAKLFVDEAYVGDAIVNLSGYVPTFRFPKSTPKIRIQMSGNRVFETKVSFLGHGSTQILFVEFANDENQKANP